MQLFVRHASHRTRGGAGSIIVVLVAENHATRLAVRMAHAVARPRDEVHLLTVVAADESVPYGKRLLSPYNQQEAGSSAVTLAPVVRITSLVLIQSSLAHKCTCTHTDTMPNPLLTVHRCGSVL